MILADFDFHLPEERIALRPADPRSSARLMVIEPPNRIDHKTIANLVDLVRPGDVMVLNDTKVISAQLKGIRYPRNSDPNQNNVPIEITLIQKNLNYADIEVWHAFAQPGRRLRPLDIIDFEPGFNGLKAEVLAKHDNGMFELKLYGYTDDLISTLDRVGLMPLPPYIRSKRIIDEQDKIDYQTHFAKHDGSVAAPTAGLHITSDTVQLLKDKGVIFQYLTLHVGPGTFLPVRANEIKDHKMHFEWGYIGAETAALLNDARRNNNRIISVGTTSLRLLESAIDLNGQFQAFSDRTNIFITPDKKVRSANIILTNFHLPKSTLFMLVCAFGGYDLLKLAYNKAISLGYRFYSYGDACWIENQNSL
jgi:S-adenosylmethionine:tRNA ribosyltransferase-isomerase